MRRVNVPLLLLFLSVASLARANDFMFSAATAPVVFPLMLLWATAGIVGAVVLHRKGVRLDHAGSGAVLGVGVFFFLLCGHFEVAAMLWMIYLALSTVYYAFPREGVPAADRRANLALHGTFLALVIVGGIVAKALYYRRIGGYSEWLARTKEFHIFSAVLFAILTPVALVWFHLTTVRRARRRAAERLTPSDGDAPS